MCSMSFAPAILFSPGGAAYLKNAEDDDRRLQTCRPYGAKRAGVVVRFELHTCRSYGTFKEPFDLLI